MNKKIQQIIVNTLVIITLIGIAILLITSAINYFEALK